MELYEGRPESTEGRLPREIRTEDILHVFLPAVGHTPRTVRLTGED